MMYYIEKQIKNNQILQEKSVTIIIPTLLKCNMRLFDSNLTGLLNSKLVKKVILINNSKTYFSPAYNSPDLEVVNGVNLSVNPAWNYGVDHCDTDYYLLLNDDVLCSENALKECVVLMECRADVDVIFMNTKKGRLSMDAANCPVNENIVYFSCENMPMTVLDGCFIFGRKSAWKPIPKDLNVFFGDNWILDNNRKRTAKIISAYILHEGAVTVNAEGRLSDDTLGREHKIYNEYYREIINGTEHN